MEISLISFSLLRTTSLTPIYHEHFSYFSFITVQKIFDFHELVFFHVEELATHVDRSELRKTLRG